MTTCLVGFISLLGSLSCSGPDPIGPRQDTLRPAPMLAVGSAGPCARVHVQIVGGTTAQASFAADSGCATGLALVGAGAVGYVKNQRKVSIPVRVVNRGPGGRDAPILVVLPRDSGVVTAPSNITARVVESNADSVGASGGPDQGAAFWTLLGSGGTITGDSTPVRTVQLVVPNKTTAARISFEIRAELPDSALPIAPNRTLFPEEGAYSLKPGLSHDPDAVYYRRLIALWLKPGVTGPAFRAVLERYAAELVGGDPSDGLMILRIADRGPSWTALTAVLDSIRAEQAVDFAGLYRNDENPGRPQSRYPAEGAGMHRSAWLTAPSLWAFRATRANSAWGCENGQYSATVPAIGIIEEEFIDDALADVNVVSTVRAAFVRSDTIQTVRNVAGDSTYAIRHSTWSIGALAARGDNGSGSVGMIWGAPVRQYEIGTRNGRFPQSFLAAFVTELVPAIIAQRPRIVSMSLRYVYSNDTVAVRRIKRSLRHLFTSVPELVWFQAAGNYEEDYTLAQLQTIAVRDMGLSRALWELHAEGFSNQIVFVAGTQPGNRKWSESDPNRRSSFLRGATPIAAPAIEVMTLSTDGTPMLSGGTSIAAPLVAGTAALLLSADPTLASAQIVDYLGRGSRVAVRDSVTGLLVPRAPVEGFPEPVYQLDAFGALALLADERPNSPPCGNHLVTTTPDSVIVLRDLERIRSLRVQGARWLTARPSAAPGGRVLSAWVQEDSLNPICPNCFSHSVATFDPSGNRLFTWKDYSARHDADDVYVLQRVSAEKTLLEIRSQATNGLLASLYLRDEAGATTYLSPDILRVHPQGRFAFGDFVFHDLRTGAATRFHPSDQACADDPTCYPHLFWDLSPDGSKLIALQGRRWVVGGVETGTEETLIEFRIEVGSDSSLTIAGPRQSVVLPDDAAGLPSYGVEGRVVYTVVHEGGDTCAYQVRPAAALGTVAETRTGLPCPLARPWQMRVRSVAAGGGR